VLLACTLLRVRKKVQAISGNRRTELQVIWSGQWVTSRNAPHLFSHVFRKNVKVILKVSGINKTSVHIGSVAFQSAKSGCWENPTNRT
jgi:hypothetical protein